MSPLESNSMKLNFIQIVIIGLMLFSLFKVISFIFIAKLIEPTPEAIEAAKKAREKEKESDEDFFWDDNED